MNEIEYLKKMGIKIKSVRNAKKMTLRELGNVCNLDYGSISRIESGQKNSHILTLYNIADKLGVNVKDFI